ncbi:MAG: hypothetical protein CMJ58_10390 [Planctomycetaceae bacterium]|nr:hypothetical protein [Planctomycetaceae bacterium]
MVDFAKRIYAAGLTGYVFLYFGEILFWATPEREGMDVGGLALTWVVYSLFGYVFLCLISCFRARCFWAVYLTGALYGWFEEGIVLQTTYGTPDLPLPVTIPWTALAWHALIDVGAGWYGLRAALATGRASRVAAAAIAIGLFYGAWAIFWWTEPPAPMDELLQSGAKDVLLIRFLLFSCATTVVLAAALWLNNRLMPFDFRPGRWELATLAAATLVYFALVTVRVAPVALWLMPALLAATVAPLAMNRRREPRPTAFVALQADVPLSAYLPLLLIPLTASVVYFLALAAELRVHTNLTVLAASVLVSVVLWIVSGAVLIRRGCGRPSETLEPGVGEP